MRRSQPQELAEAWWEASAKYREDPSWLRAQAELRQSDQRVLVISPGRYHPLGFLTEAVDMFLRRVGFQPEVLDRDLDVESHRQRARRFPRILALPVSVGSAAEVMDLVRQGVIANCALVIPQDCADNYFVRLLESDPAAPLIRTCDKVLNSSDPACGALVGKRLLAELARTLTRQMAETAAAARTDEVDHFASVQGRKTELAPDLLKPADEDEKPWQIAALVAGRHPLWRVVKVLGVGIIAFFVAALVDSQWEHLDRFGIPGAIAAIAMALMWYFDPARRHWRIAMTLLFLMAAANTWPGLHASLSMSSEAGGVWARLVWDPPHWTVNVVFGTIVGILLFIDDRRRA